MNEKNEETKEVKASIDMGETFRMIRGKVKKVVWNGWLAAAILLVIGFMTLFHWEAASIETNMTEAKWEITQQVLDENLPTVIVKIPRSENDKTLGGFIILTILSSIALLIVTAMILDKHVYQAYSINAVLLLASGAIIATIWTASSDKKVEASAETHESNLNELYDELEKAPEAKIFVYKDIVYSGKTMAAILRYDNKKED